MANTYQDITGSKKRQTSNWAPAWYKPATLELKMPEHSYAFNRFGLIPRNSELPPLADIIGQQPDWRGAFQKFYNYPPADTYENPDDDDTYRTPIKKTTMEPGAALGLIPKYGAIAANVLMNARNINKMYDIEKERITPEVYAEQTSILPEQDIPREVLVERKNNIAKMKNPYVGSDAILDTLSGQMVGVNQIGEMNKLSAERAANLLTEKKRVQEAKAANEKANIAAMNKREQIRATEDVRQREMEKWKTEALNKLRTDALNAAVKEFENFANYETARQLKGVENDRQRLNSNIMYNLQLANNNNIPAIERQNAVDEVNRLKDELEKLDYTLPSYGGIYNLFRGRQKAKNGGKLIAKS